MIGLELSPDNKFAAAYTNNNTTILLNTLISEFFIVPSPLGLGESVEGLVLLDTSLSIYGQQSWAVFDLKGNLQSKKEFAEEGQQILSLKMVETLDNCSVISWTGDKEKPEMALQTYKNGVAVSTHEYRDGFWKRERDFEACDVEILMLELSKNEKWCCATILNGFRLWSIYEEKCIALKLPNGVRNISKKFNNSNNIILSAGDKLAVSGIRQEIIVWDMDTGCLVKRLIAHFQRIVEIKSLVTETENAVLTSSIDRSIKVWNLDYIFEKEHHIDKHELTIDSLSISTSAQLA